ncbi:hypothetical protein G4V62_14750 [Bacillaceae bacterium SIJ1]|uniref:hypothetical protein n=1 Tax=Litoribacterium kuwaitense TaxID=1398745 RepID=UPI0013EA2ECD|nr:hypothetical protein [Litoribacterium kuwaitense]NGP46147.1 hypothetical protein [Litoribacterium kuwaitense]
METARTNKHHCVVILVGEVSQSFKLLAQTLSDQRSTVMSKVSFIRWLKKPTAQCWGTLFQDQSISEIIVLHSMNDKERTIAQENIPSKVVAYFVESPLEAGKPVEKNWPGYGSALDVIIDGIERTEDTAASLVLDVPRLFLIQLPFQAATGIVRDAANVLGWPYVSEQSVTEDGVHALVSQLQAIYSKKTYAFMLVDQDANGSEILAKVKVHLQVSERSQSLDRASCLGKQPSPIERLEIKKMAEDIQRGIIGDAPFPHYAEKA